MTLFCPLTAWSSSACFGTFYKLNNFVCTTFHLTSFTHFFGEIEPRCIQLSSFHSHLVLNLFINMFGEQFWDSHNSVAFTVLRMAFGRQVPVPPPRRRCWPQACLLGVARCRVPGGGTSLHCHWPQLRAGPHSCGTWSFLSLAF